MATQAIIPAILAGGGDAALGARLDELCEFAPANDAPTEELVFWLARLVAWVRPKKDADALVRVRFLRAYLDKDAARKARVASALDALVLRADMTTFLGWGGIARDFHLLGAIVQWLGSRVLPAPCRTDDVERVIAVVMREGDLRWLRASELVPLFASLLSEESKTRLVSAATEAMLDLVHQIAAQAHSPALRKLAQSPRSPFRGLYDAVAAFVAAREEPALAQSVRGRVVQCTRACDELRRQLAERGADLNTTYQLSRIEQQLARLDLLTVALYEGRVAQARVTVALVRAALRNAHARHILGRSSELVVRNLVDGTADVGEHYLGPEASSFRSALLAGMGGGALMVIATLVKLALSSLDLSPLYEGLVFALNYGAVFCAAYLLHYTIATKLPAHTAAALARTVQGSRPRRERVAAFADVLRALVRLQIGGLVGNLVVAGPAAWAIARVAQSHGHVIVSSDAARRLLHHDSIAGPSALYAALTGVFLWVSSLAGAAVDNWARANRVADSLATGVRVMKTAGARRVEPIANAIASRAGGLFGNAFLGFLLGAVPAFFAIARLPIEIRHVTVSTSSVAIAIASGAGSSSEIGLAVAGVLVIGLVNIAVSFALALRLAFRAADHQAQGRLLGWLAFRRVAKSPYT